MPRPTKKIDIPVDKDLKCILTLKDEGRSDAEIGQYFGVSQDTISRRIREYRKSKTHR